MFDLLTNQYYYDLILMKGVPMKLRFTEISTSNYIFFLFVAMLYGLMFAYLYIYFQIINQHERHIEKDKSGAEILCPQYMIQNKKCT